jgi:hypothetical protein
MRLGSEDSIGIKVEAVFKLEDIEKALEVAEDSGSVYLGLCWSHDYVQTYSGPFLPSDLRDELAEEIIARPWLEE